MLADQIATVIDAALLPMLDDLSRDIWKAVQAGMLSDDDAQRLAEMIHAKRARVRAGNTLPTSGAAATPRPWSYFPPKRRPQRSPDRQRSLHRRRLLAASGPLPAALAPHFTTGELAALRIVADEVRERGECRLTIPEIASRSGTSESTVRRAIKEASGLGLITVEERRVYCRPNLSNVVRIVSREWLTWVKRGGRVSALKGHGYQGFKKEKKTESGLFRVARDNAICRPQAINRFKEGLPRKLRV